MAVFELEEEHGNSRRRGAATPIAPFASTLGVPELQAELDGYLRTMQEFAGWEPDAVLLTLSSMAARMLEVRTRMVRDNGQRATAFRTKEIDPFLEQCDFQFKIHSRLLAAHELEFKMMGGQT